MLLEVLSHVHVALDYEEKAEGVPGTSRIPFLLFILSVMDLPLPEDAGTPPEAAF